MKETFRILGVETEVESDAPSFLAMAREGLAFFQATHPANPDLGSPFRLEVSFQSQKPVSLQAGSLERFGQDAYRSADSLIVRHQGLRINVVRKQTGFCVTANPLKGSPLSQWIKENLLGRKRDHFLLVRWLILFPLFQILEERDVFLLHAGAVNYKGKGILFGGLPGAGKTTATLALTLGGGEDYRYVADNFLLFNDERVFAFPEWIRLRDSVLSRLPNLQALGPARLRRFGRNHYRFPDARVSLPVKPAVLFIPRLGQKKDLRQISVEAALDRLLLANDQAGEFHTYHKMGLLGYFGSEPKGSVYERRVSSLKKLLTGVKCFEVCVVGAEEPHLFWEKGIQDALTVF